MWIVNFAQVSSPKEATESSVAIHRQVNGLPPKFVSPIGRTHLLCSTSAHESLNPFSLSGILKSTISKREWGHGIISEEFRKWIIVAEPVAVRMEPCSAPCCGFPRFREEAIFDQALKEAAQELQQKKNRRGPRSNFSASNAQPENLKPYWPRPGNSTPE